MKHICRKSIEIDTCVFIFGYLSLNTSSHFLACALIKIDVEENRETEAEGSFFFFARAPRREMQREYDNKSLTKTKLFQQP